MASGIIDANNMAQVLRDLSQHRRQGVLELRLPESRLQVLFLTGKIVEVVDQAVPPAAELQAALTAAGFVFPESAEPPASYAALFALIGQPAAPAGLSEEVLKRAIRQRILNKLYNLDLSEGAYYTFKIQVIECEREYLPSFSVGQLLLDLVAINTDTPRFEALFQPHCLVQRLTVEEGIALADEEKVLLDLLTADIPVEELERKALLSKYHFQDALLTLHERGLIKVSEPPPAPEELAAQLQAQLDQSMDAAFGAAEAQAEGTAEEETIAARPGLLLSLRLLNARLISSSNVPGVVAFLFVLLGLGLPVVFWQSLFSLLGK